MIKVKATQVLKTFKGENLKSGEENFTSNRSTIRNIIR